MLRKEDGYYLAITVYFSKEDKEIKYEKGTENRDVHAAKNMNSSWKEKTMSKNNSGGLPENTCGDLLRPSKILGKVRETRIQRRNAQ